MSATIRAAAAPYSTLWCPRTSGACIKTTPARRQVELHHPGKLAEARSLSLTGAKRRWAAVLRRASKSSEISKEKEGAWAEAHLESAGEGKRARGGQSRAVETSPARKKM